MLNLCLVSYLEYKSITIIPGNCCINWATYTSEIPGYSSRIASIYTISCHTVMMVSYGKYVHNIINSLRIYHILWNASGAIIISLFKFTLC